MIIQITGNVKYPITLDPSVWIFDNRKILLSEAFTTKRKNDKKEKDIIKETARRLNRAYNTSENRNMTNKERKEALKYSYVMPIKDFIDHVEIKESATSATLKTKSGDVNISLGKLKNSYLQFSHQGRPLKDDGPVYLIYRDGSNKDSPIKGIEQIIIN